MASWIRAVLAACVVSLALPAVASASSKVERRVLAEVNDYREAHGVRPVRRSRSLGRTAGRFATHILRVNRLHHHNDIWASDRFRLAGENIASQPGHRRSAARLVRMWARSEPHRHVMLNPRFAWGGVGREYGRLGSRRSTVWVLHLGRR